MFSAHAIRAELCLFDEARITLPEYTNEIWHGYLRGVGPGQLRVHGPYEPADAHRFSPNNLLIDPYAREPVGDVQWSPAHFGYLADAEDKDLSFSEEESASVMPKARVVDPRA